MAGDFIWGARSGPPGPARAARAVPVPLAAPEAIAKPGDPWRGPLCALCSHVPYHAKPSGFRGWAAYDLRLKWASLFFGAQPPSPLPLPCHFHGLTAAHPQRLVPTWG